MFLTDADVASLRVNLDQKEHMDLLDQLGPRYTTYFKKSEVNIT